MVDSASVPQHGIRRSALATLGNASAPRCSTDAVDAIELGSFTAKSVSAASGGRAQEHHLTQRSRYRRGMARGSAALSVTPAGHQVTGNGYRFRAQHAPPLLLGRASI